MPFAENFVARPLGPALPPARSVRPCDDPDKSPRWLRANNRRPETVPHGLARRPGLFCATKHAPPSPPCPTF